MEHLNFNIYAMAKPETREDYDALLNEALLMADQLNEQLVVLESAMMRNKSLSAA